MSSTPLFGVLGQFDPSTELFTAYSDADKKKVAVFISVIGKKSYATLRDLCSPDSPKDKSFSEL